MRTPIQTGQFLSTIEEQNIGKRTQCKRYSKHTDPQARSFFFQFILCVSPLSAEQ